MKRSAMSMIFLINTNELKADGLSPLVLCHHRVVYKIKKGKDYTTKGQCRKRSATKLKPHSLKVIRSIYAVNK